MSEMFQSKVNYEKSELQDCCDMRKATKRTIRAKISSIVALLLCVFNHGIGGIIFLIISQRISRNSSDIRCSYIGQKKRDSDEINGEMQLRRMTT